MKANETRTVTLEQQNWSITCNYWEQQTATWLICELTIAEVENIMCLNHKNIDNYLRKIYKRELEKQTPPKYKVTGCSDEIAKKIEKHKKSLKKGSEIWLSF